LQRNFCRVFRCRVRWRTTHNAIASDRCIVVFGSAERFERVAFAFRVGIGSFICASTGSARRGFFGTDDCDRKHHDDR
jgi:hypothetical protein